MSAPSGNISFVSLGWRETSRFQEAIINCINNNVNGDCNNSDDDVDDDYGGVSEDADEGCGDDDNACNQFA